MSIYVIRNHAIKISPCNCKILYYNQIIKINSNGEIRLSCPLCHRGSQSALNYFISMGEESPIPFLNQLEEDPDIDITILIKTHIRLRQNKEIISYPIEGNKLTRLKKYNMVRRYFRWVGLYPRIGRITSKIIESFQIVWNFLEETGR